MAIYRLLKGSHLEPELIRSLEAAYEKTLKAIDLVDRDDPITEMIARKIIEIAQTGIQDPAQLSAIAIKETAFHKSGAYHKFVPYQAANQIRRAGTTVHFVT
jgi:hypothetical protein